MVEIEQTPWLDLSSHTDMRAGVRRYVKTVGVPEGSGRAAKFEVVVSRDFPPPPEDVTTQAFRDWFARE